MHAKGFLGVLSVVIAMGTGCGAIHDIDQAMVSAYHHVTFGLDGVTPNVYLTVQRHATGCMKWAFNLCKLGGKSDSTCGQQVLGETRTILNGKLKGTALGIWNGTYGICFIPGPFGTCIKSYHPDLGKGFADGYGASLASAIHELDALHHDCLVSDWTPGGASWHTVPDAGHAECDWGVSPTIPGTSKVCDELGIH